MFMFIAILWYLQLMFPKTSPAISELDAVIKDGNNAIKNFNTEKVVKIKATQSFIKGTPDIQVRNRVEQWDGEDSSPVLD